MTKQLEILPPMMPNYVSYRKPTGKRQDGIEFNNKFDIVEFTEQEAIDYGELMKQVFIEHYKQRKSGK